jgi:hypothetical protein
LSTRVLLGANCGVVHIPVPDTRVFWLAVGSRKYQIARVERLADLRYLHSSVES